MEVRMVFSKHFTAIHSHGNEMRFLSLCNCKDTIRLLSRQICMREFLYIKYLFKHQLDKI